jgi:hypothetical protein
MSSDHYRCPAPGGDGVRGGDGGRLGVMLRAGACGMHADEAAVELLVAHGHWAGHGEFAGMLTWPAQQAGRLDHGEREKAIAESGRELQRQVLEATFAADSAREQRAAPVTSAAGIRHGTVEAGHGRGVVSIFGPVRAERMAYRNRREANLYPADARWVLPEDPYSMGWGRLRRITWPKGDTGRPRRSSRRGPG